MRPDPADARGRTVRPDSSPETDEVISGLRACGAEVDLITPEARAWSLHGVQPEYDLYVLKSKNPLDLDLAEALERAGATVVNSATASRLAKDKIVHTALLDRAGVPQPPAWTVASEAALRGLLDQERAELLVKPPAGSMAEGIHTLSRPSQVSLKKHASLRESLVDAFGQPSPMLVQRKVPNDGTDLKVYVVGDWVAAVRRPFPARTERDKRGTPAAVPERVREAVLRCGTALGLDLYGVDVLTDPDDAERFWVVDVNAFPSYKGIDGATERVVSLLLDRAARR